MVVGARLVLSSLLILQILYCLNWFDDGFTRLQVPGAAEASIRNLPPSAIGDSAGFDAMGLLAANKGKPMEGIVEQVRDGSTIRVYLLPEFQFVQVFVAGVQVSKLVSQFLLHARLTF